MGVRGRDKEIVRQIIEKAIKNGYVNGDRIEFRLKDIEGVKRGMKFCMKTSKRVFKIRKDGRGVNIYAIDFEIINCYGDDKLREMFVKKIMGSLKNGKE